VRGHKPKPAELKKALDGLESLPKASKFDGAHRGRTIVIMGNSSTLKKFDLSPLSKYVVIGCNRALFRPIGLKMDYLMVADREPYCQERDSGRLAEFASNGGVVLGSDSLFDPRICLRGPYSNKNRRAQPVPDFPVHVYPIGGGPEYKTFAHSLASFANICGSLVQAAIIMGAKRIVSIGIELKWPARGPSHHFGDGRKVGAYPQRTSIPGTVRCLQGAKKECERRGIKFFNLSPVKECPFASVFGNYSWQKFIGQ
jgi:hypothetical protein